MNPSLWQHFVFKVLDVVVVEADFLVKCGVHFFLTRMFFVLAKACEVLTFENDATGVVVHVGARSVVSVGKKGLVYLPSGFRRSRVWR